MLKFIYRNDDGFAKITKNKEYCQALAINTERVTRIFVMAEETGVWSRMHYDNNGDGFKYIDFKHDHASAITDYFNNPSLVFGYTSH